MFKKYLEFLKLLSSFLILGVFIGISNAYLVTLNWLAQTLRSWVTLTHFNVGGNNFGGLFILTSLKDLGESNNVTISLWSNSTICSKQIKWYYWTPLRATALYPLDNESKSYWPGYSDLTIEWGFYTNCNWGWLNSNNIAGQIKYIYNDKELFTLQAGVDINSSANKPFRNKFSPNFGFWNTNYLVWFFWDSEYWVTFVWWELNNPECLITETNNGTNIENLIWSIDQTTIYFTWGCAWLTANTYGFGGIVKSLLGIVWWYSISQGSKWDIGELNLGQISGTTGNYYKRTAFQIWGTISNISQVINTVNKNAETLCRGKNYKTTIIKGTINCIQPNTNNVSINADLTSDWKDTYIILKGSDLLIKKSQKGPGALHVYIDKWNLLLDNDAIDINPINAQWETTDTTNAVTSWTILRGNFIIRGLIGGWEATQATGFKHKLYIHWMLATYNTLDDPTEVRKNYIINVLNWYNNIIKFEDAFSWRCQDTGIGNDWVKCDNPIDNWAINPIVVIKKIIPSLLLR